ncbi:hypothetical protein O6H91_01G098000 [Diphasiastrum complanatum]|uniref:Uncharacterized protein n=4 Tax=Diphasiastrum complanatum TaxID=34168 RepID=A0ACC2ETN1_DIPCM|nr:hypothetical protein O6H91_01G098000 [Diphasiastrum complanatum]KAJ7569860.1 hypothetical protein O6H91_01G098000 [Diphasiastrum complanatum]KAJ7569861.1 hypothetical protein O6H91_01G098000 [Diphasiastrum complanatum]KAJ7569862.1 hypothetical protein O6H91_01G098000 [Diphasiastrum complanatum]
MQLRQASMTLKVRSPVQVCKPVTHDAIHGVGASFASKNRWEVGRRRIFIQVDTGTVLGFEVDRDEKAQSIKKRVQAALCIPTEQSALIFGDHVIEDDLRKVRNDSPLLLTRSLYRSSSTPCISPTSDLRQPSWLQPIELVGCVPCCRTIKRLLTESSLAIECGLDPFSVTGGLGGAYIFRNRMGENIAIVKPTDEEPFAPNNPKGFTGKVLGQPGLKRSIRVGETGVREVAAYLLDHDHFANVPATTLVKVAHSIFNINKKTGGLPQNDLQLVAKIASFQQYVEHDYDASDHGTVGFPVSAVHRIGILDMRIFNTDRHAGNILVKYHGKEHGQFSGSHPQWSVERTVELIPIDHGLCLPESLEDPYFEWLHWPQASIPFSDDELLYISRLDPYKDADMLRNKLPMLREACIRMLILSTTFLKEATAAGLCLAEIGHMMSRELCGVVEEASQFEALCLLAKVQVEEEILSNIGMHATVLNALEMSEQMQFDMDEDVSWEASSNISPSSLLGKTAANFRQDPPLSNLPSPQNLDSISAQESKEGFKGEEEVETNGKSISLSRFSSLKTVAIELPQQAVKAMQHQPISKLPKVQQNSSMHDRSGRSLSSTPFKLQRTAELRADSLILSDMSEKAWSLFMKLFVDLLQDAFAEFKQSNFNLGQRLGTSCQF